MAFKAGDKLGDHAVVEDLMEDPKHPRTNFGYEEFQPKVGTKLGDFTVVEPSDPLEDGVEIAFVHIDGSPEGTSQKVYLKA